MSIVYHTVRSTTQGFLLAELLCSIAFIAICSTSIIQWYAHLIRQEKKTEESITYMLVLLSQMNIIKTEKITSGTKQVSDGVITWKTYPFEAPLSGCWILMDLKTHDTVAYSLVSGMS